MLGYIPGDIGGNSFITCNVIYRIKEPAILQNGSLDVDATVTFSWDELNSETLLVDPHGHVFLISKLEPQKPALLYQIPPDSWDIGSGITQLSCG